MPDVFTLVFVHDGKPGTQEFTSRDELLRAAKRMIVERTGVLIEVRKNGQLLMGIAALEAVLREFKGLAPR